MVLTVPAFPKDLFFSVYFGKTYAQDTSTNHPEYILYILFKNMIFWEHALCSVFLGFVAEANDPH